jgi:hypothetical protein
MHGIAVVKFLRYSSLEVYSKTLRLGMENGVFDINIASDLGVTKEEEIDILLEFTDAMSDKVINMEAKTTIKTHSAILKVHADETFRQNRDFSFNVYAKRFDGSPVIFYISYQSCIFILTFFLKAPQDTTISVEILMQKECYEVEDGDDWVCNENVVTQTYGTDQMGIVRGTIKTENYDFISIQAFCSSCVGATHFAEVQEEGFEMKVLGER